MSIRKYVAEYEPTLKSFLCVQMQLYMFMQLLEVIRSSSKLFGQMTLNVWFLR
jgi:hypothetical protein